MISKPSWLSIAALLLCAVVTIEAQAMPQRVGGRRRSRQARRVSRHNSSIAARFETLGGARDTSRSNRTLLRDPVRSLPVLEMGYGRRIAGRYEGLLGHDTVELLFAPNASSYGHMLIRAGEKLYDLGNVRFARARDFTRVASGYGREMYGFVFQSNEREIRELQREFGDKVQQVLRGDLRFSISGAGDSENCAEFVTSTYGAASGNVRTSYGATSAASDLLRRNANVEGVTVYSQRPWDGVFKKLWR